MLGEDGRLLRGLRCFLSSLKGLGIRGRDYQYLSHTDPNTTEVVLHHRNTQGSRFLRNSSSSSSMRERCRAVRVEVLPGSTGRRPNSIMASYLNTLRYSRQRDRVHLQSRNPLLSMTPITPRAFVRSGLTRESAENPSGVVSWLTVCPRVPFLSTDVRSIRIKRKR